MTRFILLVVGCLAFLPGVTWSQEVVVSDFPIGVGGSVNQDFFRPYYPELQAMADTLHKYPLVRAVITGGADGEHYRQNHDAKNPALALGRAHAVRNLLIYEFHIDSVQIIIQSEDVKAKGARYRYASVRLEWEMFDLDARLDTVENRPPVEKQIVEVQEISKYLPENTGLQLCAGFSSSPFGGIPIVKGAITWKHFVFVEGVLGHTFWNNTFRFEGSDLDTRRRLVGGQVVVYPSGDIPVGIVGGWVHIEEISQKYYEYVRMSEGPVFGLRGSPFDFLSVTAVYNPARQRVASDRISRSKNDQFLVSMTVHIVFGGGK